MPFKGQAAYADVCKAIRAIVSVLAREREFRPPAMKRAGGGGAKVRARGPAARLALGARKIIPACLVQLL